MEETTEVTKRFKDASGEIRSLAVKLNPHGWSASLDGTDIPLGAFRDIVAMLSIPERP